MTCRYFLVALLVLTACTAEPFSADSEPKFHMPFTYGTWETKRAQDGKSCVITSGYRGLAVEKTAAGMRVASVQDLVPGERLSLNVNGHHYETSDTYFSDDDAAAIVSDFAAADKAYLSLRRRGATYHGSIHSDHIIKLESFSRALASCNGSAMKKSKKKKA